METKLEEAIHHATLAADKFSLPQTVFKNQDTCGWWHTNPFATALRGKEVQIWITVLPSRFFI